MKRYAIAALLLALLAGVSACTNKPMADQHSQTQNGDNMGGGSGGGGGGY
ncbi:hypothetical protein FRZ61_05140 [Hypericibacter adhaerens]|uniref:Lipoprotein n=2 Tax=Hypericibacter adhaerens TaxID=2602016 RepID=A0A5J6MTW2_9PROT|nr:hypothetical protein [Hypericibacter adhaerens]QEX20597.1 hypothetical protein FRZ61_05140 [Hypericibacter adhaerens]